MGNVWISIAHTSAAKTFSLLGGLLSLIITARCLGPDGRGVIAAMTSWVGFFTTVGYLSLGQVALHRATKLRDESWFNSTFSSLVLLAGITTLLGWTVALVCYFSSSGRIFSGLSAANLIIGFAALPFLIWEQNGSSLLMALNRLSVYNNAQIVARTAAVILICIFLLGLHWGVNAVLVAILIAQILTSCAGLNVLFAKSGKKISGEFKTIKSLLADGIKLHINAIGTFFFTNANILMVQYFQGLEQTGYFQFAVQLNSVLVILPQSASLVLYSRISKMGADDAWAMNKKLLILMNLGMVTVATLSALIVPNLIPFVVGNRFAPSIDVFNILLLTLIGQTFSLLMAPQWICRGFFSQASAVTMSVGILSVALNFLLIPSYGMYGAAWASVVTYTFSAVINLGMALWIDKHVTRVTKPINC